MAERKKMMRTAVLIHGCHLQADLDGKTWPKIVFGHNSGRRITLEGRVVKGLQVARDYDAEKVIFSTGASEINGVKEGEYTYKQVRARADLFADFLGMSSEQHFLQYLEEVKELDLESQNTREELGRNFRLCTHLGIKRVILVSSAWHIERCHAEALKVAHAMRMGGEAVPEIIAIGDQSSTEGIVILEPPHRGDRPKTIWHELTPRFFRLSDAERPSFELELNELLERHGA